MSAKSKLIEENTAGMLDSNPEFKIKEESDTYDITSELILENDIIKVEMDLQQEENKEFLETKLLNSTLLDNCEIKPRVNFQNDHAENLPVSLEQDANQEITKAKVIPKLKKDRFKMKSCENCETVWYERTLPIFNNILDERKIVKPVLCNVCDHNNKGNRFCFCNICNKGFGDMYALKIHKLRHSHQKLFECDSCGYKFKQKKNVRRHKSLFCKGGAPYSLG